MGQKMYGLSHDSHLDGLLGQIHHTFATARDQDFGVHDQVVGPDPPSILCH
jgi:hypothetical protein